MVVVDLLSTQSVPITTIVVSSTTRPGGMYSIQHYVIKLVSNLGQDQWFFPGTAVSSINKTDCHDITEILLKVALNTIAPPPLYFSFQFTKEQQILL